MEWVKKNLGFIIGLAVAVLLVGGGVWYLVGTMNEATSVDAELQAKNDQLDTLVKMDPYPERKNIEKAKEQEQEVASFVREARRKFEVQQRPENLDNAAFKSLLEATIAGLDRDADRAGVKLPDKYNFTFEHQRKQLQLPHNYLAPLAAHLEHLESLCQVLYDAKVHSLVSLKRTPVGTNEMGGTGDLLAKKVTTNTAIGAVIYPYEIVFQGFDQELAKVLAGLINSSNSFVVKTLNVERGSLETTPAAAAAAVPMMMPGTFGGMDPALARRYGLGRYAPQQPAAQPVAPTANRPGEVVLDEKPLRVTLGVELIKLLPAREPPPVKEPPPAKDRPAQAAAQSP